MTPPRFTWVRAAPARTITAPTGVDHVSVSPRNAVPAAVAITGVKEVTIWAVVGPTSATSPYCVRTARPVPRAPSAATAGGEGVGKLCENGVTTANWTVARRSCAPVIDRADSGRPDSVRRT